MAVCGLGHCARRLLGSLCGRSVQSVPQLRGVRAASGAAGQPGSYQAQSAQAARDPAAFWGPLARDTLVWDTPYHTVWDCDFSSGKIGWFLGGQLNVSGEWATGGGGWGREVVQGALSSGVPRAFNSHSRPHGRPLLQSSAPRTLNGGASPPQPPSHQDPRRLQSGPQPP